MSTPWPCPQGVHGDHSSSPVAFLLPFLLPLNCWLCTQRRVRKCERLEIYQARLLNPRLESQALLAPLFLPRAEIGLSLPLVTGTRKLSLLLKLLLPKENDGRAARFARCLLGLRIETPKRQSKLVEDHLL